MLTPHEFRPHIVVPDGASYRLHEWRCTCGARCRSRTRSLLLAEIDWWGDHVMIDARPPVHTPTIVPGAFDNAVAWRCSCGAEGEPAGHSGRRWALTSHRRHEHVATRQWYREEWGRREDALLAHEWQDYQAQKVRQRLSVDEAERRHRTRPVHPEVVKDLLRVLI